MRAIRRRPPFAAAAIALAVTAAALAAPFLSFTPFLPFAAFAADDEASNGYASDTLTVTVGYFGGVYTETRTFTLAELRALNVQYLDYTLIDNMPSVVIDHVEGVALADVIEAAGVDLNSVQSFNFWTKDKTGDYYTSLTKTYLIDTPRYCYYSLPDNFDYDTGAGNELAVSDKVWVPTVIALSDDWNRSLAGASFGSDYTNLNTGTRFRLIFGQTDAQERTASRSAKWIYAIEVTLGGAPPEAAPELPDDEVGSAFTSESGGDSQGDDAAAAAPETPAAAETPPERTTPTEPDPAPDPIPEPAPEIRALPLGYEIRPVANSLRDDGGVQQWRRDEMSQDATELPDIYKDAPVAQAAAAAFAVFILGAALQAAVINGNFSLAMGVSRK